MKGDAGFLELIDVWKSLRGRPVLRGVCLQVGKGEIMTVVGPSGGGKSTLLRCINRLVDADRGEILLNGKSIYSMDPVALRRRVGMVFQFPAMFPGTVRDNIAYGLRLMGKEDVGLVERCARDVGLPPSLLDLPAEELSGGEKQRVSIARALALNPDVLLLDEPTASLDPASGAKVEETIGALVKRRGLTVLWVTHDVGLAARAGDRVAVLRDGKIVQVAKASEIEWGEVYG